MTNSVYDFLYYDARRVGSFLAQFDPSGTLQGLRRTESVNDTSTSKATYKGRGTAAIASVEGSSESSGATTSSDASERTYDPLWSNALNLLDFLEENELISRDLREARLGQFVLAKGELSVVDLSMVKGLWSAPVVQRMIIAGLNGEAPIASARPAHKAKGAGHRQKQIPDEQQLALEMLSILPHSVHATVEDSAGPVWSTLKEEGMVVAPSDLFLKHGKAVPGEWAMLGILDAHQGVHEPEIQDTPELAAIKATLGGLGQVVDAIGPFARMLLGRPPWAYGMTPLLIFREARGK